MGVTGLYMNPVHFLGRHPRLFPYVFPTPYAPFLAPPHTLCSLPRPMLPPTSLPRPMLPSTSLPRPMLPPTIYAPSHALRPLPCPMLPPTPYAPFHALCYLPHAPPTPTLPPTPHAPSYALFSLQRHMLPHMPYAPSHTHLPRPMLLARPMLLPTPYVPSHALRSIPRPMLPPTPYALHGARVATSVPGDGNFHPPAASVKLMPSTHDPRHLPSTLLPPPLTHSSFLCSVSFPSAESHHLKSHIPTGEGTVGTSGTSLWRHI